MARQTGASGTKPGGWITGASWLRSFIWRRWVGRGVDRGRSGADGAGGGGAGAGLLLVAQVALDDAGNEVAGERVFQCIDVERQL
jgi:hypothetical protein